MRKLLHRYITASIVGAALVQAIPASAGNTAFGYMFKTKNGKYAFASFDTEKPQTLNQMGAASYGYVHPSAGEYVDGKIYTYTVEFGDITEIEPKGWAVYDAETYKILSSKTDYDYNRVVDMTYDYTTNTMYALVEDNYKTGELDATSLCVVDLATGDYRLIGSPGVLKAIDGYGREADDNLITLACDNNGQLYAMSAYRYLYKVDKFSGKVEQAAPRHNLGTASQFQSMAFDTDGTLWWAQCHPSYGHFCSIDLSTGVPGGFVDFKTDYEKLNKLGDDVQMTCLFFKGRSVNAKSPLAVTGLTAKAHENGVKKVDLSWTLPEKDYSGNQAEITGVRVYRIGSAEPVATLSGAAVSFTDENAADGYSTYEVIPFNDDTNGFPAFADLFAGYDRLSAVSNIVISAADRDVTVTWEKPSGTVNGFYADFDHITYNVYRTIAGTETQVAEGTDQCSFSETISDNGSVFYTIEPVSGGVAGEKAKSDAIVFSGVASLPYSTGFEDNEDGTQWTIINDGYKGWTVGSDSYAISGTNTATAGTGGAADLGDDWLISPAIEFGAGSHTISFIGRGSSFDTFTVDFLLGTDKADVATFTIPVCTIADDHVYDKDNTAQRGWVSREATFNVPEAGTYHLGIHNKTTTTYANLRLDNLSIVAGSSAIGSIGSDADGFFSVELNGNTIQVISSREVKAVQVCDIQGRIVAVAEGDAVDCSGFEKGIYIVAATMADGSRRVAKTAVR